LRDGAKPNLKPPFGAVLGLPKAAKFITISNMNNIKKLALLIIAAIIVVGAVVYFVKTGRENNPFSSETSSATPTLSASISPTLKPNAKSSPTPTPVNYTIPKCRLGGEITFENNSFKTDDAFFNYEKVTDLHDFIRWTITPSDGDVSIGPNMFASLELPSGRDTITIAFNSGKPKYAGYTLKASIDYPVVFPDGTKILNAVCSDETKLIIK
jgi:hypothetical protein